MASDEDGLLEFLGLFSVAGDEGAAEDGDLATDGEEAPALAADLERPDRTLGDGASKKRASFEALSLKGHAGKAMKKAKRLEAALQDTAKQLELALSSRLLRKGLKVEVEKNTEKGRKGELGIVIRDDEKVRLFRSSMVLDIAFSRPLATEALAAQYHCSPSAVRAAKSVVAQCTRLAQRQINDTLLLKHFEETVPGKKIFVRSLRWDETQHIMTVKLNPGGKPQESAYHVLVSRRAYSASILAHRLFDTVLEDCTEQQCICPLVPLLGTNSGALFDGLFENPLSQEFGELESRMGAIADEEVIVYEYDGATSNSKLVAFLQHLTSRAAGGRHRELPAGKAIIGLTCRLHSNCLCEACAISQVGWEVLRRIYTSCVFLKMGGFFPQITAKLKTHTLNRHNLVISHEPPPDEQDVLYAQLKSISVDNFQRFRQHGQGMDDQPDPDADDDSVADAYSVPVDDMAAHDRRPDVRSWRSAWDVYLSINNGAYRTDGIVHHCIGDCCGGGSWLKTRDKLAQSITKLQYRFLPKPPPSNKWTKLFPALVWFLVAMLSGGLLKMSADTDFKGVDIDRAVQPDANPEVSQNVTWAKLAGSRLLRFRDTVKDVVKITTLVLVVEPVAYITEHFIQNTGERRCRDHPSLLKYLHNRTSPIYPVLGYYSSLLSGIIHDTPANDRTVLMYRGQGYQTFSAWSVDNKQDARDLRDAILSVAAWMDDKHRRVMEDRDLQILALGDSTRTEEDRHRVVDRFKLEDGAPRNLCCVRWGLRPWFQKPTEELLAPEMACVCFRTCSLILASIGDIEARHARTNMHKRPGQSIQHMCAQFINSETKHTSRVLCKRRQRAQQAMSSVAMGAVAAASGADAVAAEASSSSEEDGDDLSAAQLPAALHFLKTVKAKIPPVHILKAEVHHELRERGENMKATSAELWAIVHERQRALTPGKIAELHRWSSLSERWARKNNPKKKKKMSNAGARSRWHPRVLRNDAHSSGATTIPVARPHSRRDRRCCWRLSCPPKHRARRSIAAKTEAR